MRVLGNQLVAEFQKKHANSQKALDRFVTALRACQAKNPVELKQTFNSVDVVDGKTVFNVGGNKFRVIVVIAYVADIATITHVLTHQEYDEDKWKE